MEYDRFFSSLVYQTDCLLLSGKRFYGYAVMLELFVFVMY